MSGLIEGNYGIIDWYNTTQGWHILFYPTLPDGEVVRQGSDAIVLGGTRRARVERLKGIWGDVEPGRCLSEELLRERRAEAMEESGLIRHWWVQVAGAPGSGIDWGVVRRIRSREG